MLKTLGSYCSISKEQKEALKCFVSQIKIKQEKINLIGKSTIHRIWTRHILDSIQIIEHLPKEKSEKFVLDVGTGAGFPGVVLHIMGRKNVILCDKSSKKVFFLKKIFKECCLDIEFYNNRVEMYLKKNVDVIVSRAFASLKKLINSIFHLISYETVLVIHKGKKYKEEIKEAEKTYFFKYEKFQSITSKEGVILKIENIKKK